MGVSLGSTSFIFFSRPICRLCDLRSHFEIAVEEGNKRYAELKNNLDSLQDTRTRLEEIVEGNKRYTDIKTRFETLQDFVADNVGISHGPPTTATPGAPGTLLGT